MFHFLRPWWLCAALLLPALVWWSHRRRRAGSVWQSVVDPHLLPRLLEVREDRRGRLGVVVASLAYLLAVFALAGPSWRQSAQPLWQSQAPLVVALDLSSASLSSDLPPSRLAQARAKLAALLQQRRGGQTGLVAFAGDAFTVAPLTDDAANVALFLDALQPDVMPRDGQRAVAATRRCDAGRHSRSDRSRGQQCAQSRYGGGRERLSGIRAGIGYRRRGGLSAQQRCDNARAAGCDFAASARGERTRSLRGDDQ
jgi:Ca-activated chloride channel family protein